MKTGIIYARVSTDQASKKETPIQSQISECLKYAQSRQIEILEIFTDEGISGTKTDRPAFQKAIDFAIKNKINHFIVFDTSRFSRSIEDAIYYKKLLRKHGISIDYVMQPMPDDPVSKFLSERIFEMFDEYYTIFASVSIKRGMKENARRGYWKGSNLPLGYKTAPEGKKKRIVKNEAEAHIYFEILKLFNNGFGSKEIAKELNKRGYTNRGKSWKYQTILKILKNPIYKGILKAGDEEFYHQHLRYISDEEWQEIQTELARRKKSTGPAKSNLFFVGLLRCGKCGSAIVSETGKGSYFYYVCSGRRKHQACNQDRLNAKKVDEFLLDKILNELFSEKRLKQIIDYINQEIISYQDKLQSQKAYIKKRITDIYFSVNRSRVQ